jgi:hypothetical protein
MRKQILFLGIFLAFMHSSYCNDSILSKVIFYREFNYQGSAISYKVLVEDSMVVKLKNNSYFSYSCLPGEYNFQINNFQNTKLHLKVEQGKTYYLRFGIRMGFWSGIPELLLVDSVSAYPSINNGSMRKLDIQNNPLILPKNRFGLNANMGGGFESFPMATTNVGKESTISFGGGYGIGLKYGHEFNKHFDLAIDLNYQFSDLIPFLNNADVTFGRGIISITPSYILPIDGGDAMRIKFGAGLDDYFGSALTIDLSKLTNGFNDEWKYKNSLGYHLSAIFELNISDNWSFNYGLKWYNVSYSFNKSNHRYPTVNKLKSPNGSGIDFLCGIYYHF